VTDPAGGWIGPNARLQLIPVLDRALGAPDRLRLFARAGAGAVPSDRMIPEGPVAQVHRAVRACLPDQAPALMQEAGRGTADYILAHRIPKAAQRLLRALPRRLSAPLLARAIARNAWTFAGSGQFRIVSWHPMVFEIADNPVIRGEAAPYPVCDWHVAVFRRLFAALVDPGVTVTETACCACGAPACRFVLHFS
jgi:divinyl protochlorophyllide a 8-vinyl-reductase